MVADVNSVTIVDSFSLERSTPGVVKGTVVEAPKDGAVVGIDDPVSIV